MLAYEVDGTGPPLLLIHGTLSSRGVWAPVRERLARERTLILVDLPGMGDSAPIPGADVPRDWTGAFDEVLADAGVERPAVAGHSMGGWTALQLAAEGRVRAALALAPAGLWDRSSRRASFTIRSGHAMARLTPPRFAAWALRKPALRRVALRDLSADGAAVPAQWAIDGVMDGTRSAGFREHYRAVATLGDRFDATIAPDVPVRVVFAERDRITTPTHGQQTRALPSHARVEHWPDAGHQLVWDATDRTLAALLAISA